MKKNILLLFFTLFIGITANSQCMGIHDALDLCVLDAKMQKKFMKKHGFKPAKSSDSELSLFGKKWYNKQSDTYFCIKRDYRDQFLKIEYRLKAEKECYEDYESMLSSLKFEKHSESISKYDTEYYNYTNDDWALILVRFDAPKGVSGYYYQVHITTHDQFKEELNKQEKYKKKEDE